MFSAIIGEVVLAVAQPVSACFLKPNLSESSLGNYPNTKPDRYHDSAYGVISVPEAPVSACIRDLLFRLNSEETDMCLDLTLKV